MSSSSSSSSKPTLPIQTLTPPPPLPLPTPQVITCPNPPVSHLDRHGYLFGYPITHSMSSLLHQVVFDRLSLDWSQKFLPSTSIPQFLSLVRDPKLYGSAVTMPHKVNIIPHLDGLTDECRDVGACNTVFRGEGGELMGANTDTIGIRDALVKNLGGEELAREVFGGRAGLVIGGGGAARSAVYAFKRLMGFERVYVVNRDEKEVRDVVEWCGKMGYGDGLVHVRSEGEARELEKPGAVVACIPDFEPVTEGEWEVRRIVETFLGRKGEGEKGAWLEMAYHPSPWTRLAGLAEGKGWRVILGTEAMIYQGLKQHSYWHGREIDEDLVREVKEVVNRELSKARL